MTDMNPLISSCVNCSVLPGAAGFCRNADAYRMTFRLPRSFATFFRAETCSEFSHGPASSGGRDSTWSIRSFQVGIREILPLVEDHAERMIPRAIVRAHLGPELCR